MSHNGIAIGSGDPHFENPERANVASSPMIKRSLPGFLAAGMCVCCSHLPRLGIRSILVCVVVFPKWTIWSFLLLPMAKKGSLRSPAN